MSDARPLYAVITTSRADFGLLTGLIKAIDADPEVKLHLIATGMHLSQEFGNTVQQIEHSGLEVHDRVEMMLSSDTPVGMAKAMGLGLIGFGDLFGRVKPMLVILLGDRFETLAVAQAAFVHRIPIVHISGGEVTFGALDDAMRHAITKLSTIHLTATESYRQRVIQLGEEPERVYSVGEIGLDAIKRDDLMDRLELEQDLGMHFGPVTMLITYHPETLNPDGVQAAAEALFVALGQFPEAHFVVTAANADADGRLLNRLLKGFVGDHPGRAWWFNSLGSRRYLSMLRAVDVVVGNSSSGLVEAPSFGTPTVDIGERQEGRTRADSVLYAPSESQAITGAIHHAITPHFQEKASMAPNPYQGDHTPESIVQLLKGLELSARKRFFDVDYSL
ncbi:MAG: UDP-N-acetylglucosamine 2-epimerase (hydrolyzing) [Magnetococcales bacterium]|nr:UDP-N-acetylglucosamine 2-epimerase (hydrolyzing) [Magnetococcales bacterium]